MDRRAARISLDVLRRFCVAARHLSFTQAARELFVTQSAISHEIRSLEQQIGKPLFRRVNRALQLTQTGQELYRAVEAALAQIETATQRAIGPSRTLAVTTTVALASTWLVPRLPRFAQRHPEIDLRVVATNDVVDMAREHIDVAIRFALSQAPRPVGEKIFDYHQFPVCSPALVRDPARPLRTPPDLARHVLLDFETVLYGRPWYDWQQWSTAMQLRGLEPAGWLRFSHYDQVIEAAVKGGGVAVGKWPHLIDHLHDGRLVAPLGEKGVATLGAFYLEIADTAPDDAARAFTTWLQTEAKEDAEVFRRWIAAVPAPKRPIARGSARTVQKKAAAVRPVRGRAARIPE